jgi:hypothetical protein
VKKSVTSERDTIYLVEQKLLELGYSKDNIQFDVQTPLGRRADIVIFEKNEPKVVIEVKSADTYLPDSDSELKYFPAARQAQSYAKELGALHFVVSNGFLFRWFITDEDGLPKLLEHPVLQTSMPPFETEKGKKKIVQVLYNLADQGRDYLSFDSLFLNLGSALLAYFEHIENASTFFQKENLNITEKQIVNTDFISSAYSTFNEVSLKTYPGDLLVDAIDEFLQVYITDIKMGAFRLPNWLTKFMIDLSQIQPSEKFLDIYSNVGDGAIAAYRVRKDIPIYSLSSTQLSYLWDKVKRVAIGMKSQDVIWVDAESFDSISFEGGIEKILVAPPFNARISDKDNQLQRSENFYLERAIDFLANEGRIVAIVPENFLIAGSQQKFRLFLISKLHLRAVISLEQFLPNTDVKASVLVLDKLNEAPKNGILMAELTSADIKQSLTTNKNKQIAELVKLLREHLNGNTPAKTPKKSVVTESELVQNQSWSVKRFLEPTIDMPVTAYPLAKLFDLSRIIRGADITIDVDGNLPLIGPAAIRAFDIDPTKLDLTSEKKISLAKSTPKRTKTNDILIHAIGPHRGQAALVTEEFDSFLVSRHLLIVSLESKTVLPEYLVIALNSTFVRKQIYNLSTGSVISGLTPRNVQQLSLPLPALSEQLQIIQQVNDIRSRQDALQANLIEAQNQLETLLDTFYSQGENNG